MWLRGQYDYWNFTTHAGQGYDTSVMLWTDGPGAPPPRGTDAGVPEPGAALIATLAGAAALRRRRRRPLVPAPRRGGG